MIFTEETENHILNKPCRIVTDIEEQVYPYVKTAIVDLANSTGVAIAANQIGVPYRWYMDIREIVYINPVILEKSDEVALIEGCLSLPDFETMKLRYDKVTLQFEDLKGKTHIMKLEGLDAQIAQHETEHLSGKLINEYNEDEERRLLEIIMRGNDDK